MTKAELDRLHAYRLAIPGRIYTSDNGDQYIGTDDRRLKLLPPDQSLSLSEVLTENNDALGIQIKNISQGTDPQDAINKSQLDSKLSFVTVDGVSITGSGTPSDPLVVPPSGGGEDLDATLTIGNDGGGQDIINVSGLQDSASIRSVDIENRQLINDNGLLWTIDWNNRMTADTSGQTSIDWENRELTDSTLTPIFDWENFAFPTLAGGGTQMLTVDNVGAIAAQAIPEDTFTIDIKMLSTNLADGITYFIGNIPQTPITASIDRNRIDIPYDCTLVGASIMFSSFSAVGTNENISIYIRVNNTTDHLVATVGAATADRLFENMGLSVALTTSDYTHGKIVCPTWSTNPTQTVIGGTLYFKKS